MDHFLRPIIGHRARRGDFVGGLASRRVGACRAVFYAEIIGLDLLAALAIYHEGLISTRCRLGHWRA